MQATALSKTTTRAGSGLTEQSGATQNAERGTRKGVTAAGPGLVVTREELAVALKVSVRTVDRMVATGDLTTLELREGIVRFYLPDVLADLRSGTAKFGRNAVAGEKMEAGRSETGNHRTEGDQPHESHERDH